MHEQAKVEQIIKSSNNKVIGNFPFQVDTCVIQSTRTININSNNSKNLSFLNENIY